jgi:hypothetical protein
MLFKNAIMFFYGYKDDSMSSVSFGKQLNRTIIIKIWPAPEVKKY